MNRAMFRSLPAAGHPIDLSTILRACGRIRFGDNSKALESIYAGARLTGSGTAALYLTMRMLKSLSSARKVVLPAYSCPSVAAAVIRAGLKPVLCDLQPSTVVLDQGALSALIDKDTLAVVAVHLFGVEEDIAAIRCMIGDRPVAIIEDATQATGNRARATMEPVGLLGDVGVLSFGRGKPLSILAGGAVILSADRYKEAGRAAWQDLAPPSFLAGIRHVLLLAAYSILFHPWLFWIPRCLPWFRVGETYFTLDFPVEKAVPAVATMLDSLWPGFESIRENRIALAEQYAASLEGVHQVKLPEKSTVETCLLRYALFFDSGEARDRALQKLESAGLGATGMYPAPLHRIKGLDSYFQGVHCPNAESLAQRIMTLPLHGRVTQDDVRLICEIIRAVCEENAPDSTVEAGCDAG